MAACAVKQFKWVRFCCEWRLKFKSWVVHDAESLFTFVSLIIMRAVRQLRSRQLPESESSEEEDDEDDEDDEFEAAAEDPFEVSSPPSGSSAGEVTGNENLPRRGLDVPTKYFLLQMLDRHGGVTNAMGYQSRLLKGLCDAYSDQLGEPGSERRRRVQYLADRWKRSDDATIRKTLMKDVACLAPHELIQLPPPIATAALLPTVSERSLQRRKGVTKVAKKTSPKPPKSSKRKTKAKTESPESPNKSSPTLPAIVSPPAVQRVASSNQKMAPKSTTGTMGSPLRFLSTKNGSVKKGE
jgi:hypothetical protein